MSESTQNVEEPLVEESAYVSPIAKPRLGGKSLLRSLKLVKRAIAVEKLAKMNNTEGKGYSDLELTRLVKRGVQDVTKSLRKGATGIVLIASDVHPVDTVAHLPILCEELSLSYAYVTSKKILSDVCHSRRPTCVVLVVKPFNDFAKRISKLSDSDVSKLDYSELYNKVDVNIRKHHPFL
ncbi:50S ribosomal protein L7Ae [Theileria orientalis strain Shintoku]|uniref:50S ribosomal protein L7Ae n=1 Tax=Theileria orientalis strain Shintoku TaxID=869250 RepID=J7M8J6_THEOR|nr:50S ribosomal protein L7Ae [Theileria orientalis strain Shintoku]PVC51766.1 50S ribosomal protein L7Ae [Theileria orientalis]BAM42353.1 50S ribosomal protein L7Ae [Theileria orientalis strain Shintoku]|eukprot:XP_009692654.1 50S ribosomal protein L7Ae [Theileria orientalis strain Shintoku]